MLSFLSEVQDIWAFSWCQKNLSVCIIVIGAHIGIFSFSKHFDLEASSVRSSLSLRVQVWVSNGECDLDSSESAVWVMCFSRSKGHQMTERKIKNNKKSKRFSCTECSMCSKKNTTLNYDSRNPVHGSIDHLEFQQVQSRSGISLCIFTLQLWRCLPPTVWVCGPAHIHHISCRPGWFTRCLCSLKWGRLCFVTQITSLSSSDVFLQIFWGLEITDSRTFQSDIFLLLR